MVFSLLWAFVWELSVGRFISRETASFEVISLKLAVVTQEESASYFSNHDYHGRLICGISPTRVIKTLSLSLHGVSVGSGASRYQHWIQQDIAATSRMVLGSLLPLHPKKSCALSSCRCRWLQGGTHIEFYGDNFCISEWVISYVMWIIVWQKGGKNTSSIN